MVAEGLRYELFDIGIGWDAVVARFALRLGKFVGQ